MKTKYQFHKQKYTNNMPSATLIDKTGIQILKTGSWAWKTLPFCTMIRDYFKCRPEQLTQEDYQMALAIVSDNAEYRKYHYRHY